MHATTDDALAPHRGPLPVGTWIRALGPISDSGDYNERTAPAGALGRVVGVDGLAHAVAFWPSQIHGHWDLDEIARGAEVLSPDHADVPGGVALALASAVADIVALGDVDEDGGTVTVPPEVRRRILASAGAAGAGEPEVRAILATPGPTIPWASFDRLAGVVGVADRLSEGD